MAKKQEKKQKSQKKVEKVKPQIQEEEEAEPKLIHYIIVVAILFGIFGIIWAGFEIYDNQTKQPLQNATIQEKYIYKHIIGNVTYNIEFSYPIEEIEKIDYPIEIDRLTMLNKLSLTRVFLDYNGTDNGQVVIMASKFRSFFKGVYHISFRDEQKIENFNCSNSTIQHSAVVLNPYSDRNGVYYNQTNGCINVETTDITQFVILGDKIIYEMIKEDQIYFNS